MESYQGTVRCAVQVSGLQSEHDGVSNIYLNSNLFNFDSRLAFYLIQLFAFDNKGFNTGVRDAAFGSRDWMSHDTAVGSRNRTEPRYGGWVMEPY